MKREVLDSKSKIVEELKGSLRGDMKEIFRKDVAESHCRASGGMAIFLGVSAAPERNLLSRISYAPVQNSSLHHKVLLCAHIIVSHG